MPPQTIDEVLIELDQIIHAAREGRDRLGFFATLICCLDHSRLIQKTV